MIASFGANGSIRGRLKAARRAVGVIAVVAYVGLVPTSVHATLTPVGDQFQVVTATESYAFAPRVAIDASGAFHVVWQSYAASNANDWDVHRRSFDANGAPLGDELGVNAYTTGRQEAPVVAVRDGGEFAVAWSGAGDGDQYGTFARLHDDSGVPTSEDLRLHEATPVLSEREPSVAADGNGFLVVWIEDARVAGVRLDVDGVPQGTFETPVDEPNRVAIDSLPAGEFVVVWSSSQYATENVAYGEVGHVDGRVFASDGTAGDGFQANAGREDPTGYGFVVDGAQSVSVAADAAGSFVAGYDSYVPSYVYNVDEQVDGYSLGAKIERFVAGSSQGSEFLADNPASATWADVAMSPGGNAVAVYDGEGILVRAIDCRGADASGGAVPVDDGSGQSRERPSVAINEAGDIVAVWQQAREDGNGFTIVGRRFRLTDACALCGDADADGRVTATDALAALRASVSLGACVLDRCDADGSSAVTATDALRILDSAVGGGSAALRCVAAAS